MRFALSLTVMLSLPLMACAQDTSVGEQNNQTEIESVEEILKVVEQDVVSDGLAFPSTPSRPAIRKKGSRRARCKSALPMDLSIRSKTSGRQQILARNVF